MWLIYIIYKILGIDIFKYENFYYLLKRVNSYCVRKTYDLYNSN